MSTRSLRYFLIGFASLAYSCSLWATTVTIARYADYFTGSGGEFTIHGSPWATQPPYVASTIVKGGFQSFCLELNEGLSEQPFWAVVNLSAVKGGLGGGSPDPLSYGTAWLYKQFATGVLAGYDYTVGVGRAASAKDLQATIWWLEDEMATMPVNPFSTAVLTQFGNNAATAKSNYDPTAPLAAGFRDVRVLNMYALKAGGLPDYDKPKQDMLVLVPDGGLTLILLGGGMLGLAVLRRKA